MEKYREPIDTYHYASPLPKSNIIKDINVTDLHKALNDDNYDEINKILNISKSSYQLKFPIINLFNYCVKNNDVELLKKLLLKNKDFNIFNSDTYGRIFYDYIVSANTDIINICFEMECFKTQDASVLYNSAIRVKNIDIIKRLIKMGHIVKKHYYNSVLETNNIEIIELIITDNDELQNACDEMYRYPFCRCNLETVKYLINRDVNLDKHWENIILGALHNNHNDLIMYSWNNIIDPYKILNLCCDLNRTDNLVYFIKHGMDINLLKKEHFKNIKYDIFKIIFDCEYNFDKETLEYILKNNLLQSDIEDVKAIYPYVGNFDFVFEREIYYTNKKSIIEEFIDTNYKAFKGADRYDIDCVCSILESIINDNKIEHLKFIIKNSNNDYDINKLFIVAICNGNLEIANLLLDINNNVDFKTAIECACYFGHYDALLFLLKYYDANDKELFLICIDGVDGETSCNSYYNKLVGKIAILNDVFNYNYEYAKIINLLLELNIEMEFDVFIKIDISYIDITIVKYFISKYNNKDELLKHFAFLKYYVVNDEIPNNIYTIVKFLLDIGANPNVENVTNYQMQKLLGKYGCDLYL